MTTGTVKWFQPPKRVSDSSPPMTEAPGRVRCTSPPIQSSGYRSLDENQKVEFDVAQGPKGLQAENIRPL